MYFLPLGLVENEGDILKGEQKSKRLGLVEKAQKFLRWLNF